MDFDFTEQQIMFRDMVRDFARKEIAPIAQEMDEKGEIPEELVQKMREAGFFGVSFPEQYGGRGGGNLGMAIIREHLVRKGLGLHCDLQNEHAIVGNNAIQREAQAAT